MNKNNKIACVIIFGLIITSFIITIIPYRIDNQQDEDLDDIERIILFSLDSCNPEYLSPTYMPKMYKLLRIEGLIYKNAWCPLAAETMNGHTTMLTGCLPNKTGIIGNSYHNSDLEDDEQPENPVQDPKHRLVNTIFEDLAENHKDEKIKTGFISGKWRLPDFLAYKANYIFASSVCKEFDICPEGYEDIVGTPAIHIDGDIYDQWTMRALTELVNNDDPDFIFVNLASIDTSGHDTGVFNPNHGRQMMNVDDMLWQFVNDLKAMGKYKSSLMIFTSDHGMCSITDAFNVHDYLEDKGIDIEHIHLEGHSGFIFLEDVKDTNDTVDLLKANGKVAVVLPRDEMYKLALNTYENRTGQIFFSCKEHVTPVAPGFMATQIGDHGGVAARDILMAFLGPGIKEGDFIQNKIPGLEDLVPTIYYIWGLAIPNYIQGRILIEIFK